MKTLSDEKWEIIDSFEPSNIFEKEIASKSFEAGAKAVMVEADELRQALESVNLELKQLGIYKVSGNNATSKGAHIAIFIDVCLKRWSAFREGVK